MDAPSIFKALSDITRLRCILLLIEHQELCVCDLTRALDLPQPKISHHLGILRKAGLVMDRKTGLWIHYRIHPELPQWVEQILKATASGMNDDEPFATDAAALTESVQLPVESCRN
jgi:ArsR family transcriptional regulator